MNTISRKYFVDYTEFIGNEIPELVKYFDFSDEKGTLAYLTKASAVYSSNIEGNSIDLNSFMNYELSKEKFKTGKEVKEIEELISAYELAQNNSLSEENLLKCHAVLSKTFLIKSKRGNYRNEQVGVFGKSGMAYLAVEPEFVEREMNQLFKEIKELLVTDLNESEVIYFASFIHLRFAHIHPFRDGNGRVARLLEKWFLTEKLGKQFCKVPSEEYYKNNQAEYYKTIGLGVNFYELDYAKCVPFLSMLANYLR
jgi:Fic family protein